MFMNPGRFFIPNMGIGASPIPMMAPAYSMPRNLGLLGRIGNGIKSVNWGGLLSGANKTLNVVNQTIPLIKQTKPMVNNMKSMIRLAKAFGSETISKRNYNQNNLNNNQRNQNNQMNKIKNDNPLNKENIINEKTEITPNDNYPNFFV